MDKIDQVRCHHTCSLAFSDAEGVPLAVYACSASPHEVTLVDETFDACVTAYLPQKVIGDRAYDSDKLDKKLAEERNVELIAPHKSNRVKLATQDGRKGFTVGSFEDHDGDRRLIRLTELEQLCVSGRHGCILDQNLTAYLRSPRKLIPVNMLQPLLMS
jgi:hypothetical protein